MAKRSRKYAEEADQYNTVEDFLATVEKESAEPSRAWLMDNFKSKSAIIRYLLTRDLSIKRISELSGIPYRHVYSVAKKVKESAIPTHVCPVCLNRRG